MTRSFAAIFALIITVPGLAGEPTVRVRPADLQGSRPLEKQTETSVVRDYLESWKSLQDALNQNQILKLDRDFIGTARDKLLSTIESQTRNGIHTRYQDQSHDLQIVFYSPEGLSIQLIDNVQYEQKVMVNDTVIATRIVHERYVVVMTPSETRWQVRIFQPESN
jgi:hypothetical protein